MQRIPMSQSASLLQLEPSFVTIGMPLEADTTMPGPVDEATATVALAPPLPPLVLSSMTQPVNAEATSDVPPPKRIQVPERIVYSP
jgi:hypothetical protein